MSLPPRLAGFSYIGLYRYFLTFCTLDRRQTFRSGKVVALTLSKFREAAEIADVVILAYCLMPDHAHLLVEAMAEWSNLRKFVKLAKQRSGAAYALTVGEPLWQKGYYDRVLRDEEDTREVARYILQNPLRAGLVASAEAYPYLGSDRWSVAELIDGVGRSERTGPTC